MIVCSIAFRRKTLALAQNGVVLIEAFSLFQHLTPEGDTTNIIA
jgi:hypothetical protein